MSQATCEKCGKSLKNGAGLVGHLRIVHSAQITANPINGMPMSLRWDILQSSIKELRTKVDALMEAQGVKSPETTITVSNPKALSAPNGNHQVLPESAGLQIAAALLNNHELRLQALEETAGIEPYEQDKGALEAEEGKAQGVSAHSGRSHGSLLVHLGEEQH